MNVQIIGNKKIEFTAQGISYILDMLANCPWKMANPLINDIMSQLKQQEGKADGAITLGDLAGAASRGDPGGSAGGISTVEAKPTNDRLKSVS